MTNPTFDRQAWAQDLLTRMGYPVTDNNVTSVLAWEYQEGGHTNGATWNPLNTTLGHATYGSMNSVGVATYPDYETGMRETIKTLNSHHYTQIRSDLQASADPATTTSDIKASPWGTWHGGASTTGALHRAQATVAAHPVTSTPAAHPATPAPAAHPATPAPAAHPATPTTTPATPHAATTTTTSPAATSTGTTAAGAGYLGADVDGLDRLSREFTTAGQVVDTVRVACEAIVAAASMFGPFGAAFVAYLKGTVIPWLTKIAEALRAMSQVLAAHSQAQKDASSSATSLPSYSTPAALPATSTTTFPTMGTPAPAAPTQTITVASTATAPLIGSVQV